MLEGTKIVSESFDDNFIVYLYDENDSPIGMAYRKTSYAIDEFDKYLFTKNLQGDIIEIYREDGVKVASYTYDAWGTHTVETYNNSDIGNINPFRYRGYYYDSNINLYYLNTRYYSPEIKRFINADSIGIINSTIDGLTDKNLYAYCDNNPVMRLDDGGEFWNFVIGAVVGAVAGCVVAALNGGDLADIIVGGVAGAVGGLVAATGLGWIAQAGISAAISGGAEFVNQTIDIIQEKETKYDLWKIGGETLRGGVTSAIGSGLGAISGKFVTKTSVKADKFFDQYLNKTFSAGLRKEIGKSTSSLIKQANKFLSQSKFYDNVTRGVSSVIGSAVSFRHLLW